MAMMISRVARVNSSHPYLENDSSSSLVSHRLRISPWLWFSITELAHQVSERVAVLIGNDSNDAMEVYGNLKKAYNTRSKLVHGDRLNASKDQFLNGSVNCDGYLRRLILLLLTQEGLARALEQRPEKVNEFFLNRLFAGEHPPISDR